MRNVNKLHRKFKTSQEKILNESATWLSKGSGWTIELLDNHYINIVTYNPLKGSCYIYLAAKRMTKREKKD